MKHTDEEIEAASRRFEEWADSLDPDTAEVEDISDLRAIAEAADTARRGEAQVVEQVAIARGHGRSWNQIAVALGVSRQAARQRFAGSIPAHSPGRQHPSPAPEIHGRAKHGKLTPIPPGEGKEDR